jgi:hypothetical protein
MEKTMSPRLLLLASVLLAACAKAPPPMTGTVSEQRFRSAIVGDDYILRVRMPPGAADAQRRYPLVIQLDPTFAGLEEFAVTAGLVSAHAAAGDWPEAIVVGIDYDDPYTRERDYRLPKTLTAEFSGEGADRFYRVLAEEILPHLDATLPTDPAQRTLVGHSNGGVFAWYVALRHTPAEAPLFLGIVAADCGYDEDLFTLERWHAGRSGSLPLRLYASRAVYNGAVQEIAFRAMITRVLAAGYNGLHLMAEEMETDHGGAVYPSFEHGLALTLGGGR